MLRLLIADDSDLLRNRLVDILSEIDGVEVIGEARDSQGVIEFVRKRSPDAVILDIRMPEGNGISALEAIKREKKPPIVIIFTNYPYLQYRKRCFDSGADYFFYKAIDFENLVALISEISVENISAHNKKL